MEIAWRLPGQCFSTADHVALYFEFGDVLCALPVFCLKPYFVRPNLGLDASADMKKLVDISDCALGFRCIWRFSVVMLLYYIHFNMLYGLLNACL